MPTRIILIRHGETRWNLEKRYMGLKDIGLNDKGIKQAKKLKVRLIKEKISRVYSSDRKRAFKFAKIIFPALPIEKKAALREMNFGGFEGLTYKENMKKYPKLYSNWLNNPSSTTIPGGDSLYDFRKRIKRFLKKIISLNKNKTIALVTHGGPIRIIISEDVPPASVNIIEYRGGKLG